MVCLRFPPVVLAISAGESSCWRQASPPFSPCQIAGGAALTGFYQTEAVSAWKWKLPSRGASCPFQAVVWALRGLPGLEGQSLGPLGHKQPSGHFKKSAFCGCWLNALAFSPPSVLCVWASLWTFALACKHRHLLHLRFQGDTVLSNALVVCS